MKTRLQAILLALTLSVSSVPGSVFAYSDIAGSRYQTAFNYLHTIGAAKGFDDGTVRPLQALNRAEALKMTLAANEKFHSRVAFHREHPVTLPLFKDVAKTDWYSPLVETAFEAGLVNGYSDGTFKPGNTVRLSEALALIFRSQNIAINSSEPWYKGYMDKAYEKNLLSKSESWAADQYLTRGQFMDIIYRADSSRRENRVAFVDPPPPPPRTYVASSYYPSRAYTPPRTYTPSRTTTSSTPLTSQGSTTIPVIQFTISIPSLGISNMLVTHPSDPTNAQSQLAVLQNGVGHLFSLPGTNGKILVYGHSSAYAWDKSNFTKIFRTVNQLKAGDKVYITYSGKQYTYEVTFQEQVNPADTSRYSGAGEELLLYTCWPPDSIKTRLLVHAKPVGTVAQK